MSPGPGTKRIAREKAAPVAAPEPIRRTAYKVLGAEGESINGGLLAWSLPTADAPGEWHAVKGPVRCCQNGLHLTTEPARWWAEGARLFRAEYEGEVNHEVGAEDDKFAVGRARLLCEELDWARHGVYESGEHTVRFGLHRAHGTSRVEAYGSSSVVAYDSSRVKAYGSSRVEAYDCAATIDRRDGQPPVAHLAPWSDRPEGAT